MSSTKTTVALLFGGRSAEHGISCLTAGCVMAALDKDRYDIVPIGITDQGRFVLVSEDPAAWSMRDGQTPSVPSDGDEVLLPTSTRREGERISLRVIRDGAVQPLTDIDVVFPLVHGPYGEDGTIQGLLELFDVPYVGSGVLGSAACMDKHTTKVMLAHAGIQVADGFLVRDQEWKHDSHGIAARCRDLGLPLFVKPCRAGSSFGVSKVTDLSQLDAAMETAFAQDPRVLVEKGVSGREVECAVLEGEFGQMPRTSLPGEIVTGDDLEFYNYESKYFGVGEVNILVPADLSDDQVAAVRSVAATAFAVLGLEGLARVDVFVTDRGVVVNEVNTIPGFTPSSMFPVLWEAMGLPYRQLLTELIERARTRRTGLR
ncbi:D-alanine--D-alanine ligase family protein [Devriesea agamarum]|uniref:D-alanine--D-alanine ligase family protein n=1 Tax=Devriesea agamarum TaxID=472569 RepID=UPI00071C8140|nr:D-alanine--D-alanine ligase family protein [Devriesea agamarum]